MKDQPSSFEDSRVPPALQPILATYLALTNQAIPGLLEGFYLHGSVALGAFTPGKSDVDFIAVTSRRCSAADIQALQIVHQTVAQQHPKIPLEGGYLRWGDLGGTEATIPPHAHIHDGVVYASGHHDINDVTWWVLKHHGIAILGLPPAELEIPVDWDALIGAMYENVNSYWARFTTDPRRILWLYADFGVEWTVLGTLRQFYSFRESDITSKIGAGRYALQHLTRRWHRLIEEVIAIREGKAGSAYRSRLARAVDAYRFLRVVIAACKKER